MSFHLITHAVCAAVIATLIRKYLYISYQYEELEILYESCTNHIEGKQPGFKSHGTESNQFHNKYLEDETMEVRLGLGDNLNKFDNTKEMEYFDNLKTSGSDDYMTDELVNDYTGTQFTPRSEEKVSISKSDSKYILPSTSNTNPQHPEAIVNPSEVQEKQPVSESKVTSTPYTSVWCHGSSTKDRICHFHNLCYHTKHKDFIFFQDKNSFHENLPPERNFMNILDMSSVANHNLHYFSLTTLPSHAINNFTISWINPISLIFNRFKLDNVMHVLHDDIFPLHHTLKQISFNTNNSTNFITPSDSSLHEKFDIQLVAMDGLEEDEDSLSMYHIFSKHNLLTQEAIQQMSEMVCFNDAYVGISKLTTWYQYGFHEPQGPLDTSVTGFHIHQSINYILANIKSDCPLCNIGQYLVLVSRKNNRLIVNEMDLSVAVAQKIGLRVMSVSLETHSLEQIVNIVHHSKGIIGMHGSLLVTAAFLQPGSILIELFPFAINPSHYTPYKTLAELPNMGIVYKSWVNTHINNTQMHPDWSPALGGIQHLENQQEIMDQKEVPKHLCCDDPSWLFHIYQDTTVHIPEIIHLIQSALSKLESKSYTGNGNQLVPGTVSNIKCTIGDNTASISWNIPWNIQYLVQESLSYDLWFYHVKSNTTSSYILPNITSHSINSIIKNDDYLVWMRCKLNDVFGVFSEPVKCGIQSN
ncbi:hypothetical protein SNE40_015415 [Patella caerulea]|uniref:Glycosyltransferase 61 catalytic domain-containing protein n=1 Tax=Patella caerulea TaxID=87958 RepID=A0AAN8JJX1_PATCE